MSTGYYPFKNLVFEGGGVKGIAYGGAVEVLEQSQITPQIERVAGTSACLVLLHCRAWFGSLVNSTSFRINAGANILRRAVARQMRFPMWFGLGEHARQGRLFFRHLDRILAR